ncbi:MAG: undecaprenyl/decaprenyl-phosphate alpha-N-acetylglucosaminyl 1-phosphate transferase [Chloroflexaceae bacterium]|nr:undecaprenyl/decaprenyl-phosphate alpha-N-acetylglucosaminyl 1-phosphate transferase [Chloroflexaceae bacterium]
MVVAFALILTFLTSAVLTALLVPPVARLCFERGWVAQPGPRRVHRVPTPTLGGIAIVGGLFATLLLSILFESLDPLLQRSPYEHLRLILLMIGALLVAIVSFVDDLYDLPPWLRLLFHFTAALVAVGPYLWDHTLYPDALGMPTEARGIILTAFNFPFLEQIHLHQLTPWLAIIATMIWIAGLQNMLNWVDGLDGLAAGITLIASTVLALHALRLGQWTVALLPLALAGTCAGFLRYNFHPASIFMGDVGAMTLGYVLSVSAIMGGAKLATALLVLGVPLLDMIWLMIWRTWQGRSMASAGRDNLHIRLIDLGFSQRQVVAFYYGLSALFGTIALIDGITPMTKLLALGTLTVVVLSVIITATITQTRRSQQAATPDE